MKLIIAGTRTLKVSTEEISALFEHFKLNPTEIVSGGAAGIDSCAKRYAQDKKMMFALFEPDWDKFGKAAGPIRNEAMAQYSDALLLIWDGKSRGSSDMKSRALKNGKKVFEIIVQIPEVKPTAEELLQDVRSKVEYVRDANRRRR